MPEEEKKEEKTASESDTQEKTEDESSKDQSEKIDYEKELEAEIEKFDKADKNREGYLKRTQKKAETEKEVDKTSDKLVADEAVVADLVAKEMKRQVPAFQATLLEDQIERGLDQLASNEAERKLIRFHFENSVGLNGTILERLENAKLIANKKTIFKTQKEMAVALQHRQGLSTTGQGNSTEGMEVKDQFLSKDQIADLKARGWDDKKIQRFKDNLRR